jgi:hypothetical protein
MERLNTNGDIMPAGTYRFRVAGVPEKGQTNGGYVYYQFQFATIVDGEQRPYSERFMIWLMAPICRALGFNEAEPGEFDFDAAWCLGKEVFATIAHEKIASGKSAGQVVARMRDIKPLENSKGAANKAAVQAQAPSDSDIPF